MTFLLEISLRANLLENNCSSVSLNMFHFMPFLGYSFSVPFDVMGGILNFIASVPDHYHFTDVRNITYLSIVAFSMNLLCLFLFIIILSHSMTKLFMPFANIKV